MPPELVLFRRRDGAADSAAEPALRTVAGWLAGDAYWCGACAEQRWGPGLPGVRYGSENLFELLFARRVVLRSIPAELRSWRVCRGGKCADPVPPLPLRPVWMDPDSGWHETPCAGCGEGFPELRPLDPHCDRGLLAVLLAGVHDWLHSLRGSRAADEGAAAKPDAPAPAAGRDDPEAGAEVERYRAPDGSIRLRPVRGVAQVARRGVAGDVVRPGAARRRPR